MTIPTDIPIKQITYNGNIVPIDSGTKLDKTVTFIVDGKDYEIYSSKNGIAVPVPPQPTSGNKMFCGWKTSATGGSYVTFPYTPANEETTLYAKFSNATTNAIRFVNSTYTLPLYELPIQLTPSTWNSNGAEWFFSVTFNLPETPIYIPYEYTKFNLNGIWRQDVDAHTPSLGAIEWDITNTGYDYRPQIYQVRIKWTFDCYTELYINNIHEFNPFSTSNYWYCLTLLRTPQPITRNNVTAQYFLAVVDRHKDDGTYTLSSSAYAITQDFIERLL